MENKIMFLIILLLALWVLFKFIGNGTTLSDLTGSITGSDNQSTTGKTGDYITPSWDLG